MRKIFTLLAILIGLSSYCQEIETEDWITDINFLKYELQKKHINLFSKLTKSEFEKDIDKIISHLDSDTDLETAMKLNQLLAKIGDSHTTVNISKFIKTNKIIPIGFSWFDNDIHVLSTSKNNYEILDKKLIAINNFEINLIIDSLKTIFPNDNKATIKNNVPKILNKRKILEYFGFAKPTDTIYNVTVENNSGVESTVKVYLEKYERKNKIVTKIDGLRPFYIEGKGKIFKEKYYKEDKIYYIQYNKCISKESLIKEGRILEAEKYPSFNEFQEKLLKTINSKDIDKLIFDMRFNSGGNSSIITNFIKEIVKNKSINVKGKLFVVIGKKTYSSAILNTLDFINHTNALIIGEETAGKPNHFGNVKSFYLPYSNMKVNFSTKYFNRYKKNINTLKPDIEVVRTFSDYKNGIDPILEFVKNY